MIQLELPYPPSVNAVYQRSKIGGVILATNAKRYREKVIAQAGYLKGYFGDSPIAMLVEIFPPDKKKRDVDNLGKALLDALQAAKVFDNDSQVKRLTYQMCEVVGKPGRVLVTMKVITERERQERE